MELDIGMRLSKMLLVLLLGGGVPHSVLGGVLDLFENVVLVPLGDERGDAMQLLQEPVFSLTERRLRETTIDLVCEVFFGADATEFFTPRCSS